MKKIYYIPITIFCFVLIYFFFVNSDKKDTKELFIEKVDINTVNNLEEIKKVEIPKYEKKIIEKTILKKEGVIKNQKEKVEVKKEKKLVLTSSIDSEQKFKVNLVSKKKYESNSYYKQNSSKYISISGKIEANEYQSFYPMSFEKKYLEFANELYLELENISTKQVYVCDTYLFSGMDSQISYNIKIDLYGDSIDCYIDSQSDSININKPMDKTKVIESIDDISDKDRIEPLF
ncbi:hypothetical protein CP965_07205 [Halarcobacter mediterraneus]|uniref:Uncharacterized protein n=1 Tax=Halarcobacter mediterraneus TaxID=2023153 RepID=A0A4Q1AYU3_9BACT|nr:hypothetical protein [Halarcobacter mediterraneus]RXK13580.1 hypothetical protein CP965_07205 [Halarcobacter mediterraneus]